MALSSRAFAAFLQAPPALTRDLSVERDVAVTAPDGTRLLTDLYLAGPREPLPTVLIRSPYGRRGIHGLSARLFAERGYHAVRAEHPRHLRVGRAARLRQRGGGRPRGRRLDHRPGLVQRRDRQLRAQLPQLHPAGPGLDETASAQGDGDRGLGGRAPGGHLPGRLVLPGPGADLDLPHAEPGAFEAGHFPVAAGAETGAAPPAPDRRRHAGGRAPGRFLPGLAGA